MSDGKFDPPYAADERTMLMAWLEYQRESIIAKVEGLTDEQARWVPAPTANSLIGVVNHLAWVETWWFQGCFLGERYAVPDWRDKDDPDWDFHPPGGQTLAETVAFYRERWQRGNEIANAATSLDEEGKHPKRGDITLRWILVHMIEETARHAGHADITRELIDGSTGMI